MFDFLTSKDILDKNNFQLLANRSPSLPDSYNISSKYQSGIQNMLSFDTADYVMTTKSDIYSFALSVMFVYRKGHVVISL
jgi:hypothetical protein